MLTIIPREQFQELLAAPLNEDSSKTFSMKDFRKFISSTKKSNTQSNRKISSYVMNLQIKNYMRESNVKFIGEGSARIAYFLPAKSISEDQSAPCCLKVAKDEKGIAQNLAERQLFRKFSGLACFPKMFDYDSSENLYVLMEVGEQCSNNYLKAYAEVWNETIDSITVRSANVDIEELKINRGWDAASEIVDWSAKYKEGKPWHDNTVFRAIQKDVVSPAVTKEPSLQTLEGLMEFVHRGGYKITNPNDLEYVDNWGVVVRNGQEVPLPIDWGFSREVADKYYS